MRELMKIVAGLFVAVLTAALVSSCGNLTVPEPPAPFDVEAQYKIDSQLMLDYVDQYNIEDVQWTESGILYKLLEEGSGPFPEKNDIVSVHYVVSLLDSTVIDTSIKDLAVKYDIYDSARNYTANKLNFGSSGGTTIAGFAQAVNLMKLNDRILALVPSKLGYGNTTRMTKTDTIPANSVLVYEIRMIEIR